MKTDEQNIRKIPEVEKIEIKDYGIIKKADIRFSPGLNIITGKNASGKTTVIRYLIEMFDLNSMAMGNRIMFEINNELNKNCLVIDDGLERLDQEKLIKVLKNLSNCKRQVILTLQLSQLSFIKNKIKANIINTKDFKLKDENA